MEILGQVEYLQAVPVLLIRAVTMKTIMLFFCLDTDRDCIWWMDCPFEVEHEGVRELTTVEEERSDADAAVVVENEALTEPDDRVRSDDEDNESCTSGRTVLRPLATRLAHFRMMRKTMKRNMRVIRRTTTARRTNRRGGSKMNTAPHGALPSSSKSSRDISDSSTLFQ